MSCLYGIAQITSCWRCLYWILPSRFSIKTHSSFSFLCMAIRFVKLPLISADNNQLPFQLPVLSMDISDDSKLVVTCSADKNVKIWGLDFGDCHKSIFAHDESIMQVAFEKKSHYFWTVSKDKMVKYWDGDKVRLLLSVAFAFGLIHYIV